MSPAVQQDFEVSYPGEGHVEEEEEEEEAEEEEYDEGKLLFYFSLQYMHILLAVSVLIPNF